MKGSIVGSIVGYIWVKPSDLASIAKHGYLSVYDQIKKGINLNEVYKKYIGRANAWCEENGVHIADDYKRILHYLDNKFPHFKGASKAIYFLFYPLKRYVARKMPGRVLLEITVPVDKFKIISNPKKYTVQEILAGDAKFWRNVVKQHNSDLAFAGIPHGIVHSKNIKLRQIFK